jgi:hypothetical protein
VLLNIHSTNSINPMSFTKLDGSGNALPDSAASWVAVREYVTGLIWEVKNNKDENPDYSYPDDADNTYTWYDSNSELPIAAMQARKAMARTPKILSMSRTAPISLFIPTGGLNRK